MNKNIKKEIPEAKSLRWLANMFPFIDKPKDEEDKINNVINLYCTAGADKLEELSGLVETLSTHNNKKYNVITLCGSTKFKDTFMEMEKELTMAGNIVLNLTIFSHFDHVKLTEHEITLLANMHKQKIDMSDKILVINVAGYIGESTKAEIEYAKSKGKEIIYLEE